MNFSATILTTYLFQKFEFNYKDYDYYIGTGWLSIAVNVSPKFYWESDKIGYWIS